MKKILMTMVAAVIAVSASAQVYLGGSIGVGVSKVKNGEENEKTENKESAIAEYTIVLNKI